MIFLRKIREVIEVNHTILIILLINTNKPLIPTTTTGHTKIMILAKTYINSHIKKWLSVSDTI